MRRIIGWRRAEGEEWIDTMRRMKKRLETSQSYYYCVPWAEKYARAQWRFINHLKMQSKDHWSRKLSSFSFASVEDPISEYIPYRGVGRPRLRWDDHIRNFCASYWPQFANMHWMNILETINITQYEDAFVSFIA